MHFQDQGRLPIDGAGVVGERSLVSRTDFTQRRAAGFEDFRDAETTADLNEFAAGDDDFLFRVRREMPQNEHQCGSVVVHDSGGVSPAQEREIVFEIGRAAAAFAAGQIVFEVVVVRADLRQRFDCGRAERSATEVSVDDDAGAVDDRLDAGGA